jgi:hypothetical protein
MFCKPYWQLEIQIIIPFLSLSILINGGDYKGEKASSLKQVGYLVKSMGQWLNKLGRAMIVA